MSSKMTKEEFDKLDLCDTCQNRLKSLGNCYICKIHGLLQNNAKCCLVNSNIRQILTVKRCVEYKEI